MHIFKYNGTGGIDNENSILTRLSASVNDGKATIHRRIYFVSDDPNEEAQDILAMKEFPQKLSAHPKYPQFTYYGNATIEPISETSKYWVAELEYTSFNPNQTDTSGKTVTSDTEPWKLKPDNISFTYPEIVVPFKMAYDGKGDLVKGEYATKPVVNSAGDYFGLQTNRINAKMSFTFNTKKWDVNNSLKYGNTINLNKENIVGVGIPKGAGLLYPPECSKITVYEENSTKIKWEYYSVTINILLDVNGTILTKHILDLGNRARFDAIDLSDDEALKEARKYNSSIPYRITAERRRSDICCIHLYKKYGNNTDMCFVQNLEKKVYLSWTQYLAARNIYMTAQSTLIKKGIPCSIGDLQCEQLTQVPLKNGYIEPTFINPPSSGTPNTRVLQFREYPLKSWSGMNLPK